MQYYRKVALMGCFLKNICPEKNHQEYACLDPQIDVTQIFPNAMNILFLNNEYEYSHVSYIHDH